MNDSGCHIYFIGSNYFSCTSLHKWHRHEKSVIVMEHNNGNVIIPPALFLSFFFRIITNYIEIKN